ncbi:MAG: class I SAM-dependent methyltransferase [Limisphaerales bacterium]
MLDDALRHETENLKKTWMQYDASMLRDYLVADVEDPSLNLQSILSRHFLLEQLAGENFAALREHEFRFAIFANWIIRLAKKNFDDEARAELLFALRQGADNFEGIPIPPCVSQTFKQLKSGDAQAIPNYIEAALTSRDNIPAILPNTFQHLWKTTLANETFPRISVVEPACGSANDYRFLESYGLAKFLDYTGFDLCEKNIQNARAMFPNVNFDIGNALHLEVPEKSFDACFVHDLYEHLSISAMEKALAETCRVTHSALCLNFFSMHEDPDHIVRPVDDYHWNTLSLDKIRDLLTMHGFQTQAIHIPTFLQTCFNHTETHNPNAYTLIARKAV